MAAKVTFALYFGNRGFFPERLIATARKEVKERIESLGYGTIMMDASATPHGAVETSAEGRKYAAFLEENRGKYDGVVLCLPNFGDENGAVAALQNAGTPILIHAYPDRLNEMDFTSRRDAACGKFSVMDVFHQYGIDFTSFMPHVVSPSSQTFVEHIHDFARVCRVVKGMKNLTVGAIGARTTAFKTIRFDELTLQKYGITTETLDMSQVIMRVRRMPDNYPKVQEKVKKLREYANWNDVPNESFGTLVKLGVVLDEITQEFNLDTLAVRCWLELEQELKVAPCALVSETNDRLIPTACEVDVCNAVTMHGLRLASELPATCLDWNNNYGEEENKFILFHCGPVPKTLMTCKGKVVDHPMFAKALGPGNGYGPIVGRIAPSPITYSSCKTEDGKLTYYLGQGRITEDEIPEGFFGCAGVVEIDRLQEKLLKIGYGGYRHHVSMTFGHVERAVREAFSRYLKYEVMEL